jgi:hypothetical protein
MAEELIADAPAVGETSLQAQDTRTDETIVDTPVIGEISLQAEDTPVETAILSYWSTIPQTIQDLLEDPPVLPHESKMPFFELFGSFLEYAKPETIVDYYLVYTATVSNWESHRYRSMAVAVTTNQHQAGFASLFEEADATAFGKLGKIWASTEARKKAIKCSTNDAYREQTYRDFEARGYIPEGQTFLLSLPALATIEHLLNASEKRYSAAMKDIEKRMAVREAKLQAKVTNDLKAKTAEG